VRHDHDWLKITDCLQLIGIRVQLRSQDHRAKTNSTTVRTGDLTSNYQKSTNDQFRTSSKASIAIFLSHWSSRNVRIEL